MTAASRDACKCLELCRRFSEYLDREMGPAELREIDAHVARCPACFSRLQSLRQTIGLCKRTSRLPVPAPLSRRLQSMLQDLRRVS